MILAVMTVKGCGVKRGASSCAVNVSCIMVNVRVLEKKANCAIVTMPTSDNQNSSDLDGPIDGDMVASVKGLVPLPLLLLDAIFMAIVEVTSLVSLQCRDGQYLAHGNDDAGMSFRIFEATAKGDKRSKHSATMEISLRFRCI